MGDGISSETKDDWVLAVLGVDAGTGDEPGEEEAGALEPDGYRAYLLRCLKQVKVGGSASFGLVLGKNGPQHRMALHRARPPKALAGKLVRETKLHPVTWGFAEPHPQKAATLLLSVEGRQIPGLCKKGDRMLKAFRPLPFTRMALRINGVEVSDIDDPADEDNEGPASLLPDAPESRTAQGTALANAARQHAAMCEECQVA